MKISIVKARTSPHQNEHAQAMLVGLENLGGYEAFQHLGHHGKLEKTIIGWGWRGNKEACERGHNVLVMERGYIGDRFSYTSLGWNGLNGHAKFPKYDDDGGERFALHGGKIKPWKKTGDYILLLGQVKNDASLQGKDLTAWYQNIATKASEIHKLPVFFRPHPESYRRGGYTHVEGFENIGGTLDECFENAKFSIAFNSNSCVDSILNGVPCYAGDSGSMVDSLLMKDLNEIIYPEREKRLHQIAWTQWTLDEIRSGFPLIKLMEMIK